MLLFWHPNYSTLSAFCQGALLNLSDKTSSFFRAISVSPKFGRSSWGGADEPPPPTVCPPRNRGKDGRNAVGNLANTIVILGGRVVSQIPDLRKCSETKIVCFFGLNRVLTLIKPFITQTASVIVSQCLNCRKGGLIGEIPCGICSDVLHISP